MKLNIFKIPIFIENINVDKLKFNEVSFEETWESKTPSTFKKGNNLLNQESTDYLLGVIAGLLFPEIKKEFSINLDKIWINKYKEKDYQEEHIHTKSHFSFIIYSKVKESNTVFLSRDREIIDAFGMDDMALFQTKFEASCRSNQIILFPSFLTHRVKRAEEDYETISGNISLNLS